MALNNKTYVNGFMHGREMCRKTMYCALGCCVMSLLGKFLDLSYMQLVFGGATVILFIATVVIIVRECRCPHCGKIIFLGVLAVTACPNCKRSLTTGKKVKKSK